MSAKGSKFGFLKKNLSGSESDTQDEAHVDDSTTSVEEPAPSPALSVVQSPEPAPKSKAKPRSQVVEAPRRVGRPTGKRSDGEHVQVTAYIRKGTHLEVKTSLLREQKGRDFSELVEELLAKWLMSRT